MKKYNLLTPEGTRDLLFGESLALRHTKNKLHELFVSHGYSEVITPTIEFYDVFNSTVRYIAQESMYKLSDNKGRLMVIRPDSTMPIARLAATRLKDEQMPLKLFYSQNIFKINPKNAGRDDEIAQSGIEIIGGDTKRSDFEAISIALEVLEELGGSFRFEIGNCAFFKHLISKLVLSEEDIKDIQFFIETKNYSELNNKLDALPQSDDVDALRALPKLFGGKEILEEADKLFNDGEMRESLTELKEVYNNICGLGISEKLNVDLGMVNKSNYYTGIIFKGYVEGIGKSVLSGGRYDTLLSDFGANLPAVGFAVNIGTALLKPLQLKKPDVLVFFEDGCAVESIGYIKELISKGLTVDNALVRTFDEAIRYGRAKGIHQIHFVGKKKTDIINI